MELDRVGGSRLEQTCALILLISLAGLQFKLFLLEYLFYCCLSNYKGKKEKKRKRKREELAPGDAKQSGRFSR